MYSMTSAHSIDINSMARVYEDREKNSIKMDEKNNKLKKTKSH